MLADSALGIVGLGLLGSAIAERLVAGGHRVVGFDIDHGCRQRLTQLGGVAYESLPRLLASCGQLLLSLPDSTVAEEVVEQLLGTATRPALIMDTTTGQPEAMAGLGSRLAAQRIGYVDATIAGSSQQARFGQVVAMVGGEPEHFAAALPWLQGFAHRVFHVGACGDGARMKLVVNLAIGLHRAVLAEALSLAAASGLDDATALEILQATPAYSAVMDAKGRQMLAQDFTPQARLRQHYKDVQLILAQGRSTGSRLPLSELHASLLEELLQAGYGDLDNSVIIRAFRKSDAGEP